METRIMEKKIEHRMLHSTMAIFMGVYKKQDHNPVQIHTGGHNFTITETHTGYPGTSQIQPQVLPGIVRH